MQWAQVPVSSHGQTFNRHIYYICCFWQSYSLLSVRKDRATGESPSWGGKAPDLKVLKLIAMNVVATCSYSVYVCFFCLLISRSNAVHCAHGIAELFARTLPDLTTRRFEKLKMRRRKFAAQECCNSRIQPFQSACNASLTACSRKSFWNSILWLLSSVHWRIQHSLHFSSEPWMLETKPAEWDHCELSCWGRGSHLRGLSMHTIGLHRWISVSIRSYPILGYKLIYI